MNDFQVRIETGTLPEISTPLLAVPLLAGGVTTPPSATALDEALGGAIRRLIDGGDFRGEKDEVAVLYPEPGRVGAGRIVLVGLGKPAAYTAEALRRAVGTAVREGERLRVARLAFSLADVDEGVPALLGAYAAAHVAAEAAGLAAWDFQELRTPSPAEPQRVPVDAVTLVGAPAAAAGELERGARDGLAGAGAANLARELGTRPGNRATPSHLAEVAARIAERHGLALTVLDREEMAKEGLHALLAVARGSDEPPRFIVLEYRGGAAGAAPLVLVGKGVTFDSGGISIKPAERMEEMKYDMSGAAAVLGVVDAAAGLGLPVNLVGILPCTENLPSGTALKPGDVIDSHLGKTIEVINTDAEGRLILADALSYARRFRPAAIVDAATLTGAVVIALGNHAVGLLGNDAGLIDEIRAAGQRAGERCWPLPLWDEYRDQMKSDVADIKNTGGRAGGTITAAAFLKDFVGDTPWAHLDIAGTAWRTEALPPYLRRGATGVPARLLLEWVRSRAGS